MKSEEQLEQWLKGNPLHDNEKGGWCCPDFSCCCPDLLAPVEVREVFVAAKKSGNDKIVSRMLMEFLGKMLSKEFSEKKVHIAGLESNRQELE